MQSNKNTVLNQQEIKDINFSQYKYYEIQQHTRNNWQYATCKINRLFGANHNVWIKLERANPGASIKDRIALAMIEDAEERATKRWNHH
jgi:cysteine synthase